MELKLKFNATRDEKLKILKDSRSDFIQYVLKNNPRELEEILITLRKVKIKDNLEEYILENILLEYNQIDGDDDFVKTHKGKEEFIYEYSYEFWILNDDKYPLPKDSFIELK